MEEETSSLCAPTDFKRMLSWQLSQARDVPVSTSRKKQKNQRKRKRREEGGASPPGRGHRHKCSDDEEEEEREELEEEEGRGRFAYLVVNSEDEEEWYYSAPESPLESENELVLQSDFALVENDGVVPLPAQEMKRGGKTKKKKKKLRSIVKLAEAEFFGPLCDLVESALSLEVDDMPLYSQAEVLSLSELCVRRILQQRVLSTSDSDLNLPFLIHALVGAHRERRSLASMHIHWLERFMAVWEHQTLQQKHQVSPSSSFCAYLHRLLWDTTMSIQLMPDVFAGLHIPLPFPTTTAISIQWHNVLASHQPKLLATLLHLTNYLFPVFTARGQSEVKAHTSLSPSQKAAIGYVNSFLLSRFVQEIPRAARLVICYKGVCVTYSEVLKVWPAYVYWARGQLNLALTAFCTAIDTLTHNIDKAITLSEIGRMFLTFGDRSNALKFFSKIQEIDIKPSQHYIPDPALQNASILALEASIWDCGWLDVHTAKQAALAWSQLLKDAARLPAGIFYLHLAACESRMMVHAGWPVGVSPGIPLDPAAPSLGFGPSQWLCELEEVLSQLCQDWPLLYYHLSLIHAMTGRREQSRRDFVNFCDRYVFFREWDNGIPGNPFATSINFRLHTPWAPLIDLLVQQNLSSVRVLQLQWRTRLLHPMYPYAQASECTYLADHCSARISLRLTSAGLLSADAHMDLPPLRCILLDPYTGSLCFSRSASLHHCYSGQVEGQHESSVEIKQDVFALPWPVRVLEVGECEVELMLSSCINQDKRNSTTNQSAILHRHCRGEHCRLDIRVAIRRELKKAILRLAAELGMEGKEDFLREMMEQGLSVTVKELNDTKIALKPSQQITNRQRRHGAGSSHQSHTRKHMKMRDYYANFSLRLIDYFVFGEATLALCFSLDPEPRQTAFSHALVFLNCTSASSFHQPRVHCVGDLVGFQNIFPSYDHAGFYPGRHLPHIKYVVVCRSEEKENPQDDHCQLVIDEDGVVVHRKPLNVFQGSTAPRHTRTVHMNKMELHFSLQERLFYWTSQTPSDKVISYSPQMEDKLESVSFPSLTSVLPIPGLLLVHTPRGLSLLHPGSLQLVEVKGLRVPEANQDDKGGQEPVSIPAQDSTFNILCVYNIQGGESDKEEEGEGNEEKEDVEKKEERKEEEGEGELEKRVLSQVEGKERANRKERRENKGGGGREGGGRGGNYEEETSCGEEMLRTDLSKSDFGSCCVALTLNNRLLILQVPHRTRVVYVLLDILLPGKVTELYPMEQRHGFILSVTQFPDRFREEMYWLSQSGQLLGMLPCLGAGPHSFISATLEPRPEPDRVTSFSSGPPQEETEVDDGSGLYVFFSDGQGGLCCVRPTV